METADALTQEQEAARAAALARLAHAQELQAQDFNTLNLDEKLWLINFKCDNMNAIFSQLHKMAGMMGGKPADVASELLNGVLH